MKKKFSLPNKLSFSFCKLTASQTKIDKLVSDNKALQETVAEKEVRAADILQQARSRIQSLAKAGKKHQKEAESYKERIQTIENAMRGKVMFEFL